MKGQRLANEIKKGTTRKAYLQRTRAMKCVELMFPTPRKITGNGGKMYRLETTKALYKTGVTITLRALTVYLQMCQTHFLNMMFQLPRKHQLDFIQLNTDLHKDLNWFYMFYRINMVS